MFYRRTLAPEDITRWGTEQLLGTNTRGTHGYVLLPPGDDCLYIYAEFTGGRWVQHPIVTAGARIGGNYAQGITLDHENPHVVYLSRKVSARLVVQRWRTSDHGATWDHRSVPSSDILPASRRRGGTLAPTSANHDQKGRTMRSVPSRRRRAALLHVLGTLTGAAALALVPAAASHAAAPSKLVLSSTGGQPDAGAPVLWSGTVRSDGPRIRRIPECRDVSCDRLRLKVKLPRDVWKRRAGGVHIAIRFVDGTPDDNLALAIYRHNTRIGSSTAQVGTAQSVLIPAAQNGAYDVYVVDGLAFGAPAPSPVITYEGLGQVVYDPAPRPLRELLPDLVALPQKNVSFGPPFEIFDDPVPPGSSCHQSEIDENGAATCLRFDQVLGNVGTGPLDIRFDRPAGSVPVDRQQVPVRQRIYRSNGTAHDVATGNVLWHAIHGHYHFDGFAQSQLWAIDASGGRAGGAPVATGDKVSFCIATTNINPAYWGRRGFGADAYPAPNCLDPTQTSGGLDHFKQGMSVGWTDEYNWFLPGQYVEVSGVADGDYILDTTVDPTSRLIESDKSNNCGSVRVRLSAMGTAEPQAQLLAAGPPCADNAVAPARFACLLPPRLSDDSRARPGPSRAWSRAL